MKRAFCTVAVIAFAFIGAGCHEDNNRADSTGNPSADNSSNDSTALQRRLATTPPRTKRSRRDKEPTTGRHDTCGDGIVDGGETCDGDCPRTCDDGDPCTDSHMTGAPRTCDAVCVVTEIPGCVADDDAEGQGDPTSAPEPPEPAPQCGDGVVDVGETCDPASTCVTTCDDGDACTIDAMSGAAATCDVACSYAPVTSCIDGDGCCPSGCTGSQDDDCASQPPPPLDCTDDSTWPEAWKLLEDEIFAETNRRRTDPAGQMCGSTHYPPQQPLEFDARLREAARCHLVDMTENNFFSHTGTDDSRVGIRVDRTGYYWQYVGENLAAGNETAEKIVDQWINSETHCKNLMKAPYEDLGVGYMYHDDTTYLDYQAQVFGTQF